MEQKYARAAGLAGYRRAKGWPDLVQTGLRMSDQNVFVMPRRQYRPKGVMEFGT